MQILYRVVFFFLFMLYLPRLLLDLASKKKTFQWVRERLFPKALSPQELPLVFVHAVSVGEVMAVEPVLRELKKVASVRVVLSTVTMTGMETAKKRCSDLVDQFCFLPFDFRFSVRRLFQKTRPDLIVFSEGDVWPEFLFQAKKSFAKVAITNAKISDRSFSRFKCFPSIGRWLFSKIDLILAQNELYAKRFQKILSPRTTLLVSGNTKGDVKKSSLEEVNALRHQLGLESEFVVTLGSTHAPEEEKLLFELQHTLKTHPEVRVIVVPRHPHRFQPVFEKISSMNIAPTALFSTMKGVEWRILVVDQMGLLEPIYGLSSLAVICGSFVEHVGGHNALEALQWKVPCIVGPHMRSQKTVMEMSEAIGGIVQIGKYSELSSLVERFLVDKEYLQRMSKEAQLVSEYSQGAAFRCADSLRKLLL